jgi:hypothetical protein
MPLWVSQEDPMGCTVASVAMLAGCSYCEVREAVHPDWDGQEPLNEASLHQWLEAQGFEIICECRYFRPSRERNPEHAVGPWPPEPFAPLHWVSVTVHAHSRFGHSVVMLADGTVLDPETPAPRRLTDYFRVDQVRGVYRPRQGEGA